VNIRFHPEAAIELEVAFREGARYGRAVSLRLRLEVARAMALLGNTPDIGEPLSGACRRLPLRGFPFALVYYVARDTLYIVAVAHSRKRPGYWAHRR
jgi:toxin ParE1/3/4